MLHVLNTLKDDKSWSFVGGLGVGNIHKLVGVESGKYLLFYFILFYFIFLATLHGMQDLSSPTRDRTRIPCIGSAES